MKINYGQRPSLGDHGIAWRDPMHGLEVESRELRRVLRELTSPPVECPLLFKKKCALFQRNGTLCCWYCNDLEICVENWTRVYREETKRLLPYKSAFPFNHPYTPTILIRCRRGKENGYVCGECAGHYLEVFKGTRVNTGGKKPHTPRPRRFQFAPEQDKEG